MGTQDHMSLVKVLPPVSSKDVVRLPALAWMTENFKHFWYFYETILSLFMMMATYLIITPPHLFLCVCVPLWLLRKIYKSINNVNLLSVTFFSSFFGSGVLSLKLTLIIGILKSPLRNAFKR